MTGRGNLTVTLMAGVALLAVLPCDASATSTQTSRADAARAVRQVETGNTRQDRADAAGIEETLDAILGFSLDISALVREEDTAWEAAQEQVSAFRTDMAARLTPDLIAQANDLSGRPAQRLLAEAERSARSMETRISRGNVESTLADTRRGSMFARYGVPLSMRERLIQLARLYPDSEVIRSANATAEDVLGQLGSFEDIEAQADANYAALVADTRMYDAVRSDPAQEADFVSAYWASPFSREFSGGEVVRIHLTSRSWSIERNALGEAVSRDQGASLAIRAPDGSCHVVQGLFEQAHAGGGRYGATRYRSGDTQEMLCDNIPG